MIRTRKITEDAGVSRDWLIGTGATKGGAHTPTPHGRTTDGRVNEAETGTIHGARAGLLKTGERRGRP
jgi:hypothetical protein